MKNFYWYTIIILSLITIGVVGFLFYQKITRPIIFDNSKLPSIILNGREYKTTGAILNEDSAVVVPFNQFVRLASMGTITTSQYAISTSQYGGIEIGLNEPYDKSKQAAIDWLNKNGFDRINLGDIKFINITQ